MILFVSCKNGIHQYKDLVDNAALNTEKAEEVTIIYSTEGVTKAKLFTKDFKHIQSTNPSYIEMKNGLEVEFYNDSLEVQSKLTAKYGKYFEQNGNVLVRDSVVITNIKNEKLNTEELVWNEKLQKFYTEKFVTITTPTQVIYGDGLESNQNFSVYKITNIKGMIGITQSAIPHL
ncbi:MAG: LPS export ABC transporter periplasmic protein LptC [Chitinophagaceae bacterium]|nr:LPS export ABC transporter periplasmic protein LptC [Chitinophagaceae bacterium]HMN32095.1 LPS export ABC transporter periplasmic protein LptC [Chitinophagaceae bacterium]